MDAFARCFLLVFGQLAAGGFMALAVPPFHELERGFYKSTAGVYLGAGLLALAGQITLLISAPAISAARAIEVGAWTLFCAAAAVYLSTLWGERMRLRARAYLLTLLSGVLALAASAESHRLGATVSIATVLYPLNFFCSALLLGGATCGMMLGHWYLIDPGLSIEPLMSVLRLFVVALVLQLSIAALTLGLLWVSGGAAGGAVQALFSSHRTLLAVRVVAGPLAALLFAFMIWRTLLVPQTMAATGLFYIATLAAIVGEMLGRFILFRTSLPL